MTVSVRLTAEQNPIARSRDLSNLQFALLLTVPVLVFLLVLMVYPLCYALWLSMNNVQYLLGQRVVEYVGFENYIKAYQDVQFWHSTRVSLQFTVEAVVLAVSIGLGLALVMNAARKYSKILNTVIIVPWAVSTYGTAVMWFYLVSGQTGIFTTVCAWFGLPSGPNLLAPSLVVEVLAMGYAWNIAPLVAFFLLAGMKATPKRLYHLAQIDGLGFWGRFVHVTLPPLRFSLFVFTSIVTMFSLKLSDYVSIMTRGGPGDSSNVLPYYLYDISFQQLDLSYGAAMSFYLLALIVVAALLLYVVWGRHEEKNQ